MISVTTSKGHIHDVISAFKQMLMAAAFSEELIYNSFKDFAENERYFNGDTQRG